MDFSREWDQFLDITNLTFPLPPYAQGRNQEEEIQGILPQSLKMKLLGRQYRTNYTDL